MGLSWQHNLCSHPVLAWCALVRHACDDFSDPLLVDLPVHRATAWGMISVVFWGGGNNVVRTVIFSFSVMVVAVWPCSSP